MVKQIRDIESALKQHTEKKRIKTLEKGRNWAGQSIVANRDLPVGAVLKKDMIDFKRPGKGGLSPAMIDKVVGKKIRKMIEEDEQIKLEDLY